MAFWTRARQLKPKFVLRSNELRRCYTLPQASCVVNEPFTSRTFSAYVNNHNFVNYKWEFFCNVRFFAAPAQVLQKKEEKGPNGPRLNEHITAHVLRLVSDEGHRVVSRFEALKLAKHLRLDLVEVDRVSDPPVCKIIDYHKEKYLRQMKEKERAKSKPELKSGAFKEVKFAAKIKQNDLQIKADMVKRLMESGHRVKCTAIDPTDGLDLGTLLSRFSALIKDIAFEESEPKVEKKQAFVVVRHIKFGPSKKGSGKKALKVESKGMFLSKDDTSAVNVSLSTKGVQLKGNAGYHETGTENENEQLLDENGEANKSEWDLFHGDDDSDAVFNMEDCLNRPAREEQSGIVTEKSHSSLEENSELVLEFAPPRSSPSMPVDVPKQRIENRYARDPRMQNPSKIPTATHNRDARNAVNKARPIPELERPPRFTINPSSQMRHERFEVPAHEASNQASPRSNARYSPINAHDPAARNRADGMFQAPNQGEQPQVNMNVSPQPRTSLHVEVPAYEVPRQDSPNPGIHNSPSKSYGIFSSQAVNTREQSAPAENNRYGKKDPTNSTRSRDSTVSPPYGNPPTADPRIGGFGVDMSGEGRLGRFSTDSSVPNNEESQTGMQRR